MFFCCFGCHALPFSHMARKFTRISQHSFTTSLQKKPLSMWWSYDTFQRAPSNIGWAKNKIWRKKSRRVLRSNNNKDAIKTSIDKGMQPCIYNISLFIDETKSFEFPMKFFLRLKNFFFLCRSHFMAAILFTVCIVYTWTTSTLF